MSLFVSHRQIVVDEVTGERGLVTAKQPPAALAGLQILRQGGNAVDAAVTAAFASGVVLPLATGVASGGYLIFHDATAHQTHVVDFALQAPGGVRDDMFELDPAGGYTPSFGWRQVRDEMNRRGPLSMAIPGNLAGLSLALERFGTITLAQALAPAIRLAEEGFPLSEELAAEIVREWRLIRRYPATFDLLTDEGRPYASGERWRNPTLARTLRRLAEHGAADFYYGQIARDIAADLAEMGGHITTADLAGYRPRLPAAPLSIHYRDVEVHAAPGATGAITALQTLKLLEGFDLPALDPAGADSIHFWSEAARLAFADRGQYVADPEFVDVPARGLLDDGYAAARRALIREDRALGTYDAGDPWAYEGRPRPVVRYAASQPFQTPGTSHVGAIDAAGNAVALTDTLVGWSGIVLPRTGIIMNNGMMWFDPEPGRADSIAPHKRGLNNMVPAIVLRNGVPLLAAGARGGRKIIGTVAQVISNVVDHGMTPQQAISAPRIDCSEPATAVDRRIPASVRAALEARGHRLNVPAGRVGASAGAIFRDSRNGHLRGGEEPTGQGIAAGLSAAAGSVAEGLPEDRLLWTSDL